MCSDALGRCSLGGNFAPVDRGSGAYGLRREVCTGCWWGSQRERGHWGDPDVDGTIILRCIVRTFEGVVGTGWTWLRIGTGGGHL
jgi:hypothetical protein